MIQLTPQMKFFVSIEPVDFRRGIDGMAQLCREKFSEDPFSGKVFLFTNRRRQSVKILVFDGQGFWFLQKRLSRGSFRWWPTSAGQRFNAQEISVLLWNGNPQRIELQQPWRPIS